MEIVAVTLITTRESHLVNLFLKSPREISLDQWKLYIARVSSRTKRAPDAYPTESRA